MMPSPPETGPPRQPTIRIIARAAGVSIATVSRALREHGSISSGTVERVREIARQLGYRSDPKVVELMNHLRQRHKPGFQSIIAALTTNSREAEQPYAQAVRASAESRALELGYGFEIFRLADGTRRDDRLYRMLRARCVQGILVLPMKEAASLAEVLPWPEFSSVAATYALLAPEVPRVVPDQFGNTLLTCRRLAEAGYRRIGFVISERLEQVVEHRFSAGVMWQNTIGGTEFVMPIIQKESGGDNLVKWFQRGRPDAIISGTQSDARLIARELGLPLHGPVRFVTTDCTIPGTLAGIDQRPQEVGATAVELLHARIQLGSRGAAKIPSTTLIPGRWVAGRRGRVRRPAAPSPG